MMIVKGKSTMGRQIGMTTTTEKWKAAGKWLQGRLESSPKKTVTDTCRKVARRKKTEEREENRMPKRDKAGWNEKKVRYKWKEKNVQKCREEERKRRRGDGEEGQERQKNKK